MQLFVSPLSSNARRAVLVVRLTGLPVEITVVDMRTGDHRKPAYLAINPNHKVPALVDGSLHLWESGAICQYLAAKAGRTDLWPTEPAAQADVSRWMFWNHTQWAPPIGVVNYERAFKKMFGQGEPDEALVEKKLVEVYEQAAMLDAHLADRDWVAQGHLTLADIQLACTLSYVGPSGMSLAAYPHLSAWFARIQAMPEWKATEITLG